MININSLIAFSLAFSLIVVVSFIAGSAKSSNDYSGISSGNLNLSPEVLQWQSAVRAEAERQEIPDMVPYILAIIQVESGGRGKDIMQSSESLGLPMNSIQDPIKSIEQGVKHLKNGILLADVSGVIDFWAVVQSYNFGTAYVSHLASSGKTHTIETAEMYSKNVVAPSLGNSSGMTYSYVNTVSQAHGKTYLYSNGGNFYYADLVRQYVNIGGTEGVVGEEFFQKVMQEVLKYEGNPYVWGGAHPNVGFDCSGLLQWAYGVVGISIPRVTHDQYAVTVPVDIKDAKPGDLIFFKGTYGAPDYISHVGIYVDETRMFDSNGSGIGYHYWTDVYWSAHFAGIRRIVQ